MKKFIILVLISITVLSGCNLAISFLDSFGTTGDNSDEPSDPADIVVLNDNIIIPHDGSVYDIGNSIIGTEKSLDFIVENRGGEDLHLYNDPRVRLDVLGDEFKLIQDAHIIISSGESSLFSLVFTPPAGETYQTSVSLENNDPGKSPYSFIIKGTGTEIPIPQMAIHYGNTIILNGDVLDTGGFKINNEKKEVFHIRNIGTADLVLDGEPYVQLSGDGFSLINDAYSPLEAGSGMTFQIGFLPLEESEYLGTVHIESNDPEFPGFEFTISGFGTP